MPPSASPFSRPLLPAASSADPCGRLLGGDRFVRVHRAAYEAPGFDVVEHGHLGAGDGPVWRGDQVHPLDGHDVVIARGVGPTTLATLSTHTIATLPVTGISLSKGPSYAGTTRPV